MVIQSPIILASGFFSQLRPGDTVPGLDAAAQASGNAAIGLALTAQASGNAGISTGLTALASGNAGISTGLTAFASGNAGISTGLTALASGNAGISTGLTALASGNAGISLALTAQASGNAALPKAGGTMTGSILIASGTVAAPGLAVAGDASTGIYSPGQNQVAISTNGTQRATVDSSGRLLVGTASARANFFHRGTTGVSPNVQFETATGSYNGGLSIINNSTAGYAATLTLGTSHGSAIGSNTLGSINAQTGTISFSSSDGTNLVDCAQIRAEIDATPGTNDMPGRLVFSTTADGAASPTERLRIDSSGRLGIGTTNISAKLNVKETSGTGATYLADFSADLASQNPLVRFIHRNAANTGLSSVDFYKVYQSGFSIINNDTDASNFTAFNVGASERARIDSSGRLLVGTITSPAYQLQVSTDSAGKPSTNTWTIVSDERIKEDIELADLDICYDAIKTIPLKRFKWKDEVYTAEQVTDRRKLGWIAQDVEAVFPKAVNIHEFKYNQVFEETVIPAVEEELDDKGKIITPAQPERIERGELISEEVIEDCRDLNSDQLYAAMYGAIQKLMQKVETLEAEVAALKAS